MITYCRNVKTQPDLIWRVLWWQKPTQNIQKSSIHLLLLLICHQSLKVLHFLPFKIELLLTKFIFLEILFSQETNHIIWWSPLFWFFAWALFPFPGFCLTKGFEFNRSYSACEASGSSFLFLCSIFVLQDLLSLSSNSSTMSRKPLSSSPSSSTSIPNARFSSLSTVSSRDLIHLW